MVILYHFAYLHVGLIYSYIYPLVILLPVYKHLQFHYMSYTDINVSRSSSGHIKLWPPGWGIFSQTPSSSLRS